MNQDNPFWWRRSAAEKDPNSPQYCPLAALWIFWSFVWGMAFCLLALTWMALRWAKSWLAS